MATSIDFDLAFHALTGHEPFPWQRKLYERLTSGCVPPRTCDIPTGLGKTSVIAIWLIALANHPDKMPRRLVYVVNRRTVVDQTTDEVEKLRRNLGEKADLEQLRKRLGSLAISTLRGQFADNKEWSADPARPAVICGTVDMIGSRLLFSGYRIGYKSKPLHAGFLGQDVLLVHDEAHLEPAFQELLETIEEEQREVEQVGDLPWPKLRVMALSATGRRNDEKMEAEECESFGLTDEEGKPPKVIPDPPTKPIHFVWRRLTATKKLELHSCDDDNKVLVEQLIAKALDHKNSAVLLFARSVEHVESVARELRKSLKNDKLPENVATLTGTMRGYERDKLVSDNPVFARFLPKGEATEGTAYLVCTSAGEVGVNISADHLVCDLSTFDSMAQRFGRVNRFGDSKDTTIDVVRPTSFGKKDKSGKVKTSELDGRRQKTLELLQRLNGDASPAALGELDSEARVAAFAPKPTILPATDILFDAWSLTTIRDKMPGRPPVEPYLHGVVEWEPPRTQVAWREEVDLITGDLLERNAPEDLLDDYPLKPHELLSDRSDRVLKHLDTIANRHPESPAWLVDERGLVEVLSLKDLADKNKKDRINGQTVLLPPKVGGLSGGLLDGKSEQADDVASEWYEDKECNVRRRIRVRVRDDDEKVAEKTKGMRLVRRIDLPPPGDDEDMLGPSWHWYTRPRSADDAGSWAATKPVKWQIHTDDVTEKAKQIVEALNLPEEMKKAIVLAAKYHDLGKRREVWQRSIGNPNPKDWHAKSGKPWRHRDICPNYRHELGSLLDVLDTEQEHLAELEPEMRDLVLHLIAAHHGHARPHFPTDAVYDPAPGSDALAREQALETPRRFARLQRKYGRWGLAYLESLLRAADWAASAEPSKTEQSEFAKATKEEK